MGLLLAEAALKKHLSFVTMWVIFLMNSNIRRQTLHLQKYTIEPRYSENLSIPHRVQKKYHFVKFKNRKNENDVREKTFIHCYIKKLNRDLYKALV